MRKRWGLLPYSKLHRVFVWDFIHHSSIFKKVCPSKTNLNIFFLFWNKRSVHFLEILCIKENLQYNMFDFSINNFTVWNQSFLYSFWCAVIFLLHAVGHAVGLVIQPFCYWLVTDRSCFHNLFWRLQHLYLYFCFPAYLDFSKYLQAPYQ